MTPLAPLRPLLDSGDDGEDDVDLEVSIYNSVAADGEIKKIKEQLPAQHPVKKLFISAPELRKKLSTKQLDNLLQMIGADDFIKLVFRFLLRI